MWYIAVLTGVYLAIGGRLFAVSLRLKAGSIPALREDNAAAIFAVSAVAWPLMLYWVLRSSSHTIESKGLA
jgi:hypothetical protein